MTKTYKLGTLNVCLEKTTAMNGCPIFFIDVMDKKRKIPYDALNVKVSKSALSGPDCGFVCSTYENFINKNEIGQKTGKHVYFGTTRFNEYKFKDCLFEKKEAENESYK